jgi:hypothetical protein
MNEITISKKHVLVGLLLIILCAGIALGVSLVQRVLQNQQIAHNTSSAVPDAAMNDDQLAQEAALAGAQAFYTVDYQAQQDWIEELCAISTEIGCAVDKHTLAPTLWADFIKSQTKTTAQASINRKVLEQILPTRGNARAQVWLVQIDLSGPWPQQAQPITHFEGLALVIHEQAGWKFERFLTQEESRVYEEGNLP